MDRDRNRFGWGSNDLEFHNNIPSFKEFVKENYKSVGSRLGSNEGGVHEDEHGNKYYVKYYKNPDQGKAEVLAGKIYHHMGINTVQPEMAKINNKSAVVSKWDENLSVKPPKFYDKVSKTHAHQLGKMYHAAILTKNWDIAGLEHDNIMHNKHTDNLHAIDHGAAFHFRARGSHKDFGSDIDEHKSLREPHHAAGHVFNSAFKHHPEAEHNGVEAVRKINDDHIHHLFKNSGLNNWEDLHKNFQERKKKLLDKYRK